MKKAKMCAVLAVVIGLLGGCSKFSPDETAVSIGKDGEITAAVFDTLDESYYDAEELKKMWRNPWFPTTVLQVRTTFQ